MGTSRSTEGAGAWTAEARVYSGRPDPKWELSDPQVVRLTHLWDSMAPWLGDRKVAPRLGYRGCLLRGSDSREWEAFGGCVILRAHGSLDLRRDPDQKFERALLATAPKGLVPPVLTPLSERD